MRMSNVLSTVVLLTNVPPRQAARHRRWHLLARSSLGYEYRTCHPAFRGGDGFALCVINNFLGDRYE